jgi:hypothetical protein
MSPSMLNKYMQAARDISTHLVLQPNGFTFAPHPMLAESDREKYTIQRIVEFYDRAPPITPITSRRRGASSTGPRSRSRTRRWRILRPTRRSARSICRWYGEFWRKRRKTWVRWRGSRRLWRMLPGPEHKQPELVREGCVKMRDYVVKVRKLTARLFRSPKVMAWPARRSRL